MTLFLTLTLGGLKSLEKDSDSNLYIGHVPQLPGAHTQGETLDELYHNLQEVTTLCLEELSTVERATLNFNFVGTQTLSVSI